MNDAKMYGELLGLSQRQEQLAKVVGMMNMGNVALLNEVKLMRKQLQTLQGVVSSLQQDVAMLEECTDGLASKSILHTVREQGKEIATLEEKFSLMEKVLPHMQEPCEDDIPDGEAERADFERWMEDDIPDGEAERPLFRSIEVEDLIGDE